MRRREIEQKANELHDLGVYEGSEIGEYWRTLTRVLDVVYGNASPEFVAAVEKEIEEQHAFLKSEFRLIEETETIEQSVKYLVHISELDEDE